jgi:hypothetical protein
MRENFPNGHGLSLIHGDWNDPYLKAAILVRIALPDGTGFKWVLRKDHGALKGFLPADSCGLRWDGFIYTCRIYSPADWEKARETVSNLPSDE